MGAQLRLESGQFRLSLRLIRPRRRGDDGRRAGRRRGRDGATGQQRHGQLDALYDSNTRLLRWKTSWSALSGPITAVQFHGPAEYGQTGPVTMVWPAPFGPTYEGRATLTPQQAVDLLDGRWYVNVFTAPYPSGELRGQLRVVH